MGLPTISAQGDARFSYDGGRRGQVLLQLHRASSPPREWLLSHSLLSKFSSHVQVLGKHGAIGLLAPLRLPGGGMVQGLSNSGAQYSLLASRLELRLRAAAPAAAPAVDPAL